MSMLLPVMTSEDLAAHRLSQFMRGKKMIVAGWFNRLSVFARRFTPDLLLVPAMGWLFRVRDAEGNLQLPRARRTPNPGRPRTASRPLAATAPAHRPDGQVLGMVEPDGIEPTTSAVRLLRSPN